MKYLTNLTKILGVLSFFLVVYLSIPTINTMIEDHRLNKEGLVVVGQPSEGKNVFYMVIKPDMFFSQMSGYLEQIQYIKKHAKKGDHLIIDITSPGGAVQPYGLAANYLEDLIQSKGLTSEAICTQVCASGGYLLAVQADEIGATDTAIVGSIGVVAELTNLQGTYNKTGVYKYHVTAGESKRTLTAWTKPTEELKAKFQEDLVEVHDWFKSEVRQTRNNLADDVFTGKSWMGMYAKDKGLVDFNLNDLQVIRYSLVRNKAESLVFVNYNHPKTMLQKLLGIQMLIATPQYIAEYQEMTDANDNIGQ